MEEETVFPTSPALCFGAREFIAHYVIRIVRRKTEKKNRKKICFRRPKLSFFPLFVFPCHLFPTFFFANFAIKCKTLINYLFFLLFCPAPQVHKKTN